MAVSFDLSELSKSLNKAYEGSSLKEMLDASPVAAACNSRGVDHAS